MACKDCGILWRGITHDLSKFSPIEFIEYAENYTPGRSPVDVAKEKYGYCKSWQHHKGKNTHHWQYWMDYIDGEPLALKIPYWDLVEMICDWIGAGKAYNQTKWTEEEPYKYWLANKDKMCFHPDTKEFIEVVLGRYLQTYGWAITADILKLKFVGCLKP